MKTLLPVFFLLVLIPALGAQADSIEQAIDDQVWRPFIRAFNAGRTDSFMAVHSAELIRLPIGYGASDFETYRQQNFRNWERSAHPGEKRSIELRFAWRSHTPTVAYHLGYYKVTITPATGSPQLFYGRFNVILRRENGLWKILLDADTGEASDEALFRSGTPLDP